MTDGYGFFRTIEHALQLMHYKQTHLLPDDERELSYLARRLDMGPTLTERMRGRYPRPSDLSVTHVAPD